MVLYLKSPHLVNAEKTLDIIRKWRKKITEANVYKSLILIVLRNNVFRLPLILLSSVLRSVLGSVLKLNCWFFASLSPLALYLLVLQCISLRSLFPLPCIPCQSFVLSATPYSTSALLSKWSVIEFIHQPVFGWSYWKRSELFPVRWICFSWYSLSRAQTELFQARLSWSYLICVRGSQIRSFEIPT